MIQNVLTDIGGVGIYGVISISLFFVVFAGALVWVCSLKKEAADAMATLPLEDGVRPSPAAESHADSTSTRRHFVVRPRHGSAPGDGRTPEGALIAATKGDSRHE